MSDETITPDALPETPTGWSKACVMHLNFGGGKGSGIYAIKDEQGRRVKGIGFAYNTAEGTRGFTLEGDERFYTWSELREAYQAAALRASAPATEGWWRTGHTAPGWSR